MSDAPKNFVEKGNRFIREFASHQGKAYQAYGDALARYGSGELGAVDVAKTAAGVYFKEVGRLASSAAEIGASLSEMVLSAGGVRVLNDKKPDTKTARSKSGSTAA